MNLHAELPAYPFVTYLDDVQLSDQLQAGEIQGALLVACSDMGAMLPFVCADPKANLLIFQDIGHRCWQDGIASLLGRGSVYDHLVVYGHTDCKFARFLIEEAQLWQLGYGSLAKSFQVEAQSALRQYGRNLTKDENQNWRRLNEWNVLSELKCALLHPGVLERALNSQLQFHGWLYVAEKNQLAVFDPETEQFLPARAHYRETHQGLRRR